MTEERMFKPGKAIYTGQAGAPTSYANHVEIGTAANHLLLRFFHQRPMQEAPLEVKDREDGKFTASFANYDTMEYALQQNIAIDIPTAELLQRILDFALKERRTLTFEVRQEVKPKDD